jgi:predicted ATPase
LCAWRRSRMPPRLKLISSVRAQQAKSWELRAAMSLALWRDQGKQQRAHDLLAPVYGRFTEGFDTLGLKEARALLDELTEIPTAEEGHGRLCDGPAHVC